MQRVRYYRTLGVIFDEIFKLIGQPATLRFGLKCPTEVTEFDKKIRITDFNLSLLIRQNTFRIECIRDCAIIIRRGG